MSLAHLREIVPRVGLTIVIAAEQISVKTEKIEGDTAEYLAEIYAPVGALSCRSIVSHAALKYRDQVDCHLRESTSLFRLTHS